MTRRVGIVVAMLLATLTGSSAQAANEFNTNPFRPSAHPYDLWNTRTSLIAPHLTVGAHLLLHYENKPLGFLRPGEKQLVVEHLAAAQVMGSIALWDRLSIGVAVPVAFVMKGQTGFLNLGGAVDGAAMGDVRLDLKAALLRSDGDGFGIAAALVTSFPTNMGEKFFGDDAFTFSPSLIFDYHKNGHFVALNAGLRLRTNEGFLDILSVNDEMLLGLGGGVSIVEGLLLGAEAQVRAELQDPFQDENETLVLLRGGLRYMLPFGLGVEVGGGSGLLRGYGNPAWSAFLGLRFEPPRGPKDRDGDGLTDDIDQCPDDPEDKDGFQDEDGCPDPDNDQDGIPDVRDKCPDDPEDADGFEDEDGCPDPDNDRDGIPDVRDKCPNEPEDPDGFQDDDGCPDPDNDQDGIPDVRDKCPNDPETINGFEDEDGCPDKQPLAKVEGGKIVILQKVYFDTAKARIQERSYPVLLEVARVLKENPDIIKLRIEGYTDSRGSAAYNRRLSQRRAEAVRKFLIQQGIDPKRLVAKGYGEDKPIASNDTPEGRAQNRRVEFKILKRSTKK